ncbi:MAG: tungsten cofactor oxidoreductase radical SAM maturase [Clostridia bacterium]|nr:tungsten cofactor oxidoreductase radical SAM maturase [Clostridia bacterium]
MPLRKAYIELTNKCNLDCTICYRRSWNEKLMDMNLKVFEKIKKDIEDLETLKSVVIGGIGEPSFAPLIHDALEVFGQYDLTLTTNAVTLNAALLESIVKHVNMIMVSIDGLEENYSKIRGINLKFILDNINKINELKRLTGSTAPTVGIQFVMSKDNIGDVFSLIDLADSLKVNMLVLSNLLPQTKENTNKILYKRYENTEIKHLFNKILNYSMRRGITVLLPNCELKTERRCSFVEDEAAFINVSGDIVPCYRLSHTYKEYVFGREKTVIGHSFGNVMEKSLKDIWNSREYSSFRQIVSGNRYPSCMDCDLVEGCDMVRDTASDCYAGSPSCADCLWTRKFTICP